MHFIELLVSTEALDVGRLRVLMAKSRVGAVRGSYRVHCRIVLDISFYHLRLSP